MAFATLMRDAGTPAITITIFVDEAGAIRMATPQLPTDVVNSMLTAAMTAYGIKQRGTTH